MNRKIESLTPEQQARFGEFRERWIAIGLSTEPANRLYAERAIYKSYRCGGLPPPKEIVWSGSPLSQGITRAITLDKLGVGVGAKVRSVVADKEEANVRANVWDNVRTDVEINVWANVGSNVWANVGDNVGNSVRDGIWTNVGASVLGGVRANVRESMWDNVRDGVWDSLRTRPWDNIGASVRTSPWDSIYGQHDAGWLSSYRYLYEVCGLVKETEKFSGLWALAQNAGWAIPHRNICWVSERHHTLRRDEQNRLHCLTGPAIAYPDGWKIYAINGVRVPEFVVETPRDITVNIIQRENNIEVRRIMIEQYGTSRYVIDAGAKPIHADNYGTLYRIEQANDEPLVMVKVINSTPDPDGHYKSYFLRVPPDMTKAQEAVAWTFGLRAEDYSPIFES